MKEKRVILTKVIFYVMTLLLLLAIIVGSIVFVIPAQFESDFEEGMKKKYKYLKSMEEKQKIIIIGDSNTCFGFDTEYLSYLLNRDVVSIGLEGGMGFSYCFNIAMSQFNEGDILLVSYIPETISTNMEQARSPELIEISADGMPELLQYINREDYSLFLKAMPAYLFKKMDRFFENEKQIVTGVYTSKSINDKGNMVFVRDESTFDAEYAVETWGGLKLDESEISPEVMCYLNECAAQVEEQGGEFYYSFAPTLIDIVDSDEEEIKRYTEQFNEMAEFSVISKQEDFLFSMDCIYDSPHHLNDKGAKIRTEIVAKDILRHWETGK